MSRFQDTVTLTPLPRPLVDDVVRALLDVLERLPFTDGRLDIGADFDGDVQLIEGEHLTAGARYRIVLRDPEDEDLDVELTVVSWNRTGESQLEFRSDLDGHVVNARVELAMAGRRPHAFRVEGDYQGPGPLRMLQRATWDAEVRFEEWWAVLGQRTSPISLRIRHPLAIASLHGDRGKDKDGHWSVDSTLRFRGRWIARPLAAIGLLIMRGRIRRILRDGYGHAEAAWNGAVPGMVKRGLQERVALRRQVKVRPVSREWAEEYVAALHRAVEGLRFEKGRLADTSADIQLLEGRHIQPGARYRLVSQDEADPVDVEVTAWDFAGPSRVEFSGPDRARTGWAELDSAQKPIVVRGELAGEIQETGRLSAAGEADLERWWAGVGGSGGDGPAITATVDHPLGEGTVSIAGSPAEDDRWAVDVTVAVEGRDWARPLVAVAGLIGGIAIDEAFKDMTEQAAEDWDRAISEATKSDPEQAAEATLQKALEEPAGDVEPD